MPRHDAGLLMGRFNDPISAEYLRSGVVAGFVCRWCIRPATRPVGATGVMCVTCDLVQDPPAKPKRSIRRCRS